MLEGGDSGDGEPDAIGADGIEQGGGLVVPAAWLDSHRDGVSVVDVRDAWEFEGIGHVPGAVNIPFDEFRSDDTPEVHRSEGGDSEGQSPSGNRMQSGDSEGQSPSGSQAEPGDSEASPTPRVAGGAGDEGMLPGADVWSRLLGEAGITRGDHVVAYDDTHGVFAARFLVTALLYGHPVERLHLLDGDYSAWNREYGSTTEAADATEATYEVTEPEVSPLVDYETVRDIVERGSDGDSDVVVLDTREPEEYEAGHIPGAVQLDWRELVDEETRGLKPRQEQAAVLEAHGVEPGTEVLLYCNTARRISHTYVVLRYLGYEDVAFYEGSLTEWERRGGPVERGAPESI